MTKSRGGPWFIDAVIEKARQLSRGEVYLIIVAFHLIVTGAVGYAIVWKQLQNVGEAIESYGSARDLELQVRERGQELRTVGARLAELRHAIHAHDSLENGATMAHSILRESVEKQGLRLKGFVATEEEAAHLVTLEGAFANVVSLIAALPQDLVSFRVRRFTARSSPPRADRLEVEFLIESLPDRPDLSPLCNTDAR